MKRIWISGYRNFELNTFGNKDPKIKVIKYALQSYLKNNPVDWVLTGPNLGTEQWASEVALNLDVNLAIISPYQEFASRWNEANQAHLQELIVACDFDLTISNEKYQNPGQLIQYQKFMLEHTDEALLLYDPEHEGKPKYSYQAIQQYQKGHDYPCHLLDFYELEDYARELSEESYPS
ncbi:MAG: DUF1273 domain-containing protein [Lactobacillus sp.]|nr:DUF1273 domain-containing protein [Lactobacillus sp.]